MLFNPDDPRSLTKLDITDLLQLPGSESDLEEYKSSRTPDDSLKDKIRIAASAFWNTGGGLFVAGVDGVGKPDGGISLKYGKQSRRDWIDQALHEVNPAGPYEVHSIEGDGSGINIAPFCAVFLIGFGRSEYAPHMAHDKRYYLRAGAHSIQASHFIVEALFSRRSMRTPSMHLVVRRNPKARGVLQVGLVLINESAALDVSVSVDDLTKIEKGAIGGLPARVPLITQQFPFFFDVHRLTLNRDPLPRFTVLVEYSDLFGNKHKKELPVNFEDQLGPEMPDRNGLEEIAKKIEGVTTAINKKK